MAEYTRLSASDAELENDTISERGKLWPSGRRQLKTKNWQGFKNIIIGGQLLVILVMTTTSFLSTRQRNSCPDGPKPPYCEFYLQKLNTS
jgi:hypothetical protein